MLGENKNKSSFLTVGLFFWLIFSPLFLDGQNYQAKQKYENLIQHYARSNGVPSDLIHSIIKVESNYNERALSPKGAMGLMQLMPGTAKYYGVNDPYNPEENIRGGVLYLKDLIRLYNGQTNLVLAAYNAGQEALAKFNGIPPYPETREYIRRVMSLYDRPYIPSGLPIIRLQDESGKVIFTNDPLYLLNQQARREIR